MTLAELLRGYVAADEREEADRCAMLRLVGELQRPLSRDEPTAHFTASAFVVDETCERVCLVEHVKLGRLLQPGGHIEPSDLTLEAAALARRARRRARARVSPGGARPFDLDIHEIPERPGEPAHFHLDVRYLRRRAAASRAPVPRGTRSAQRVTSRSAGWQRKRCASKYLGRKPGSRAELERARRQPGDGSVAL